MAGNRHCDSWTHAPIGSLLTAIIDYRGKTPPKSPYGIPCLSAANVKGGKIDLSQLTYVSEETYKRWTTRGFPEPGDVLITTEAPVGEVASFPGDRTYLMTRRIMALRGKPGLLDNGFLKYALLAPTNRDRLLTATRGTTVPRVLKTDITGLLIPVPPLPEQRAIAHILGTLDDKIELNRRMNETLEAMATAIFKSWFVEFDPVRAKMDGQRPEGMDAATAKLFPDGFEESSLGEIPQGWQAVTLGELCDQYHGEVRTGPFGTTLHAEEYSVEGIPVIAVRDISNGYLALDHQTPRVSAEVLERLGVFRVQEGDILFGRKGAVERSAYISECQSGWVMGSDCIRLRLPLSLCPVIWAFGFRTPSHVAWMQQHATGTTMASLNQSILRAVPMVIPPISLLDRLAKPFVSIVNKMEANRAEIGTLTTMRNLLLSPLLSGDIAASGCRFNRNT